MHPELRGNSFHNTQSTGKPSSPQTVSRSTGPQPLAHNFQRLSSSFCSHRPRRRGCFFPSLRHRPAKSQTQTSCWTAGPTTAPCQGTPAAAGAAAEVMPHLSRAVPHAPLSRERLPAACAEPLAVHAHIRRCVAQTPASPQLLRTPQQQWWAHLQRWRWSHRWGTPFGTCCDVDGACPCGGVQRRGGTTAA